MNEYLEERQRAVLSEIWVSKQENPSKTRS